MIYTRRWRNGRRNDCSNNRSSERNPRCIRRLINGRQKEGGENMIRNSSLDEILKIIIEL